jgi:hypothetical protein
MRETYELEKVKCGKPACKSCPHGPYWYAYRTTKGGRVVKRYIGKELPPEDRERILRTAHIRTMAVRRLEEEE